MRSIWKGSINFGLVNIPIKLYAGVQNSTLDLDMLDERDHARIKFKRINEDSQKEVPYDHIVKGYFLKDRYIVLDEHDFEEAAPEKNKMIELENFVELKTIDPIYFETSYYIEPEKQGVKAYTLLLKALVKSKTAGVARFVLRNTENLCVIHPRDGILIVTKIRFHEEIRSTEGIKKVTNVAITKKEMEVGLALIKQYSSAFDISQFKDEYSAQLLKIIKAKAKGKHVVVKRIKPRKASSDDLYDQLIQSLGNKKRA
uniref:non-homologous end joining protein Ku n=1 Tax=Pedobacter schmidteae TaxID=2201271 RepID=UPI000EABA195|nr:Ku protein [Pedobacter schmidteae]